MKYVIEHLEPRISRWVMLEYIHISKIVGKRDLLITNVRSPKGKEKLSHLGEIRKESVTGIGVSKALILDPKAEKELCPEDAKRYEYLIFGGILGDYPPQGRTHQSISSRMQTEKRCLGPGQMFTDTAVLVAHMIMQGKRLQEIPFIDDPAIPIREGEEVELPFRCVVGKDGEPVFADGLVDYLRKRRTI